MEILSTDNYKLPKKYEKLVNYIEENWNGAKLLEVERFEDDFCFTFLLDNGDCKSDFHTFAVDTIDKLYERMEDKLSIVVGSLLGSV